MNQTPATPKQTAFFTRLLAEREHCYSDEDIALVLSDKRRCSTAIDYLLRANRTETVAVNEPPKGIHFHNDTVYRVVESQAGRLYAKKAHLTEGSVDWEYVGRSPLAALSIDTMMTLDQMSQLGQTFNVCLRCAATLTAVDSVFQGLGPVCVKKATAELIALGIETAPQGVLV